MRNEANWQNAKWRRSKNAEDIKDTTKRRRETTTETRRRRRRGRRGDRGDGDDNQPNEQRRNVSASRIPTNSVSVFSSLAAVIAVCTTIFIIIIISVQLHFHFALNSNCIAFVLFCFLFGLFTYPINQSTVSRKYSGIRSSLTAAALLLLFPFAKNSFRFFAHWHTHHTHLLQQHLHQH